MDWLVTIESEPVDPDSWEHLQDDLMQGLGELPALQGVIGWGRLHRLGVVFSVTAASVDEVLATCAEAVRAGIKHLGGELTVASIHVDVQTEEDFGERPEPIRVARERGRPVPTQVLTASEVALVLKVSRQRVYQLIAEDPTFPAPWAQTNAGALYDRAAIEDWNRTRRRGPGRPRKMGPEEVAAFLRLHSPERFASDYLSQHVLKTSPDEGRLHVEAAHAAFADNIEREEHPSGGLYRWFEK